MKGEHLGITLVTLVILAFISGASYLATTGAVSAVSNAIGA